MVTSSEISLPVPIPQSVSRCAALSHVQLARGLTILPSQMLSKLGNGQSLHQGLEYEISEFLLRVWM